MSRALLQEQAATGLPSATAQHLGQQRRRWVILVTTLALLALSFCLDLTVGPGHYSFASVLQALFQPAQAADDVRVVVHDIRLPIASMAVLVGVMLAVSGASMQTILRNPLAEPFTLGISAAASFGASMAIALGWSVIPALGVWAITTNAFVFALLVALLLYGIVRVKGASTETMILTGIAMLFTFNALTALLQYGATETQTQQIVFWTFGSLMRASPFKIAVCAVLCALIIPLMMRQSSRLTLLQLGDERAASMGVNVGALRLQMLVLSSLLAAVSVSFVGTIGFIGLVGPHMARMIVGENQKYFLPMAALCGGLLLSLTSVVSKTAHPGIVYPVGIITSLIGVPFFFFLALRRQRSGL